MGKSNVLAIQTGCGGNGQKNGKIWDQMDSHSKVRLSGLALDGAEHDVFVGVPERTKPCVDIYHQMRPKLSLKHMHGMIIPA